MADWKNVIVSPETPLADAIAKIDACGLQVALVLGPDGHLLGILTDGNVRRAILAGKSLQVPVSEVMNPHPAGVPPSTGRSEILALMRHLMIQHVPLINDSGQVVGLSTLREIAGMAEHPNWVVLMAGGLGRRLRPLTEKCPKPLLEVGGKPILESILESFSRQGFKRFFISLNYRAELIREHFGSGESWGVQLEYLHESVPLGTAGALSLLPERPAAPIIVMNGDLLTSINFDSLLHFHAAHDAVATMAVHEYDFQVPYGVVRTDGVRIEGIEEKPVQKFFVNAGIYALSPEVLAHVPTDTFFNMPTLFERLISAGRTTAAYPLRESWIDIGGPEEYERANQAGGGRIASHPEPQP